MSRPDDLRKMYCDMRLLLLLPLLLFLPVQAQAETLTAQRQAELVHMVRQDCGACHGMTLQGGLGSPLLPTDLRDKPVDSLIATVLQGRPGTAMPPWQGLIDEAEARWVIERLQTGFPQE